MSSELLSTEAGASRGGSPSRGTSRVGGRPPRRAHGPIDRWWVRTHRWAALSLGLLFLIEATTGAVLLYGNDLARATHPRYYHVTPSAAAMSMDDALRLVRAEHPELEPVGVQRYQGGLYLVRGDGNGRDQLDAFVDPGARKINAIAPELPRLIQFMVNIHDCGLTCKGLPGYQEWMSTPLPGLFGEKMTLSSYLLGALGVLLTFLAVSGAIVWWPGPRALVTGFVVRRGRGAYARDLDLHRVVGIVAVPFLLMWGLTGAAFFFQWPGQIYFALLPGQSYDRTSAATPGSGPVLSLDQARDTALAAHPGAEVTAFDISTPEQPGGTYGFRLRHGYDPYGYWNYAGSLYVGVDSHGGGLQDYAPERAGTPTSEWLWNSGFYYGLHFGSAVAPLPRLIWLVFGLSPVLLAVTGTTVWLTKSRSARNRRARRRATRTAARPSASP